MLHTDRQTDRQTERKTDVVAQPQSWRRYQLVDEKE